MPKTKAKKKPKKLTRSSKNKVISGVAGGLGEHLGYDANLLRVLFVIFTIFYGFGLVLYLVLWLFLPSDKKENQFVRLLIMLGIILMLFMVLA